jgi:hypothetical protein
MRLKKQEDARDHWPCQFFGYCWDSGMSRLPTTKDCPECGPKRQDAKGGSVFRCLGPVPSQQKQIQPPQSRVDLEKKKISIIVRDGALTDSIVLRNAGFSGCTA